MSHWPSYGTRGLYGNTTPRGRLVSSNSRDTYIEQRKQRSRWPEGLTHTLVDNLFDGLVPEVIQTFSIPSISTSSPEASLHPENFRTVSAYSWADKEDPTILVPGSPRRWLDRALPFRVERNTGKEFVDQNLARMTAISPLLPLLLAVNELEPTYDWPSLDVFIERTNLAKLLSWIRRMKIKDFRMNVEMVGKTLIFGRWETDTVRPLGQKTGYNANFQEAAGTRSEDCKDAVAGNHRVIEYEFGGLKIMSRFQADAFVAPATAKGSKIGGGLKKTSATPDDLANMLAGLAVSKPTRNHKESGQTTGQSPGVQVVRAGTMVPHSSLIELKTRARMNAAMFDWKEIFLHVHLTQTPSIYLAVHDFGNFSYVDKRTLNDPAFEGEKPRMERSFAKLRKVMDVIKKFVKGQADKRVTLVCKGGVLTAHRPEKPETLFPLIPDAWRARFA